MLSVENATDDIGPYFFREQEARRIRQKTLQGMQDCPEEGRRDRTDCI